jgi:hypothetical protein
MDDVDLLRARPELAPSPETVARHRRQLADAIGSPSTAPQSVSGRRRRRIARVGAAVAVVLAAAAATLLRDSDDTTRVATTPGPAQAPAPSSGRIVPCGSGLPTAIPAGRPEPSRQPVSDPSSVHVRIYACRLDRFVPETGIRMDGGSIREAVTTLRELMDRFGGLEGTVLDEFGRAHPISLAPLAGENPDTTAVGLIWSAHREGIPPSPAGQPQGLPTTLNLNPPWVEPSRP